MKTPTTVQTTKMSNALCPGRVPRVPRETGLRGPVVVATRSRGADRPTAAAAGPRPGASGSVGIRKLTAADLIRYGRSDGEPPELLEPVAVRTRQRELRAVLQRHRVIAV